MGVKRSKGGERGKIDNRIVLYRDYIPITALPEISRRLDSAHAIASTPPPPPLSCRCHRGAWNRRFKNVVDVRSPFRPDPGPQELRG